MSKASSSSSRIGAHHHFTQKCRLNYSVSKKKKSLDTECNFFSALALDYIFFSSLLFILGEKIHLDCAHSTSHLRIDDNRTKNSSHFTNDNNVWGLCTNGIKSRWILCLWHLALTRNFEWFYHRSMRRSTTNPHILRCTYIWIRNDIGNNTTAFWLPFECALKETEEKTTTTTTTTVKSIWKHWVQNFYKFDSFSSSFWHHTLRYICDMINK